MNPIAVTAGTFSADAREAIRLARQAQFAGILFDAYGVEFSIPELSQTGRREFRHLLANQEMRLVGLQGDLGPNGLSPAADLDRVISHIDRAMEAAVGLGAPLLCLEIGMLAEPIAEELPRPVVTQEQAGLILIPDPPKPALPTPPASRPYETKLADSVGTALVEIGVRADRYGVMVALRASLSSFAALEAAIGLARCPWIGVDLDPTAMLVDAWGEDELFSRMGAFIRHIRGRDAIRGSDRRSKPVPVGQGSVDWPALLHRAAASDYQGWITADPYDLSDRTAGAISAEEYLLGLSG